MVLIIRKEMFDDILYYFLNFIVWYLVQYYVQKERGIVL